MFLRYSFPILFENEISFYDIYFSTSDFLFRSELIKYLESRIQYHKKNGCPAGFDKTLWSEHVASLECCLHAVKSVTGEVGEGCEVVMANGDLSEIRVEEIEIVEIEYSEIARTIIVNIKVLVLNTTRLAILEVKTDLHLIYC